MPDSLIQIIGFIPAFIFPLASISQLFVMYRKQSSEGVSVTTWLLVFIANLSLYIYTQKYDEIQSILALLGAAALNLAVALYAIYLKRKQHS